MEARTAFVSRGYAENETRVWDALKRVLQPCVERHGIKYVDLEREPKTGNIEQNISEGISTADLVIVVLYLRKGAVPPWIHSEAQMARDRGKQMLVYCHQDVDDALVPACIGPLHYRQRFSVRKQGRDLAVDDAAGILHVFCDAVGRLASDPLTETVEVRATPSDSEPQDILVGWLRTGRPTVVPWPTVEAGIERLGQQVTRRRPEFRPDVLVGINSAGLMAAAHIQAQLGDRSRPVGAVVTTAARGKRKRRDYTYSLPTRQTDVDGRLSRIDRRGVRAILVVDAQLKSGHTAATVMDYLRSRYPRATVHLAILCACLVPPRSPPRSSGPESLADLIQGRDGSKAGAALVVPDFLAYLTEGTVLLPMGLN